MLKIKIVPKLLFVASPVELYLHAPAWLSEPLLFQAWPHERPVRFSGGFITCNALCEGLGETTQFAAFEDLLQI